MAWLWRTNEGVSSVLGQDTSASVFQAFCLLSVLQYISRMTPVMTCTHKCVRVIKWAAPWHMMRRRWHHRSRLTLGQLFVVFSHVWKGPSVTNIWALSSTMERCNRLFFLVRWLCSTVLFYFGSLLSQLWWKVHTQLVMLWHALASEKTCVTY